jgi:hypothetical protein
MIHVLLQTTLEVEFRISSVAWFYICNLLVFVFLLKTEVVAFLASFYKMFIDAVLQQRKLG